MFKPYRMTLKRAVTEIRKAYTSRTLQMHGASRYPALASDCRYESKAGDKTYHCAVGCTLPKKVLEQVKDRGLNSATSVDELFDKGIITGTEETKAALLELQRAHDNITTALSRDEKKRNQVRFAKALRKYENQVNA